MNNNELLIFINKLSHDGINLSLNGDKLKIEASVDIDESTVAQLRENKSAIMALLAQMSGTDEGIKALGKSEYPLSYLQQQMLLAIDIFDNSHTYNFPFALRLQGQLNVLALQQSFNSLIERHQVLRTIYPVTDGVRIQHILPQWQFTLDTVDLAHLVEPSKRIGELTFAEAAKPFDLSCDLNLRGQLLKIDAQTHILLVTQHHIASDGWSVGILVNELSRCYQAHNAGLPVELEALPIQYGDYASWQREQMSEQTLEQLQQQWVEQLAGVPTQHNLPLDNIRPSQQNFDGQTYSHSLSGELTAKVQSLAQAQGATLFMTLHCVFNLLLQKYSGDDIGVTGTPTANREQTELSGLIGFFVNTLVLALDMTGDPDFNTLLGREKAMALWAFSHQQLPFESLVEEIQPTRTLSNHPLFQIMFGLQNNKSGELALPGLSWQMEPSVFRTSKYDLSVEVVVLENDQLQVNWEYSTELFEAQSVTRMAEHFELLLSYVTDAPNKRLSEYVLPGDSPEVTTKATVDETTTIVQMFEARVSDAPQSSALTDKQMTHSYVALNQQANRLAHRLKDKGVGADTPVGICLGRGVNLIVAVLAIMKAGGCYVPLDPDYPQSRLTYMAQNANVKLVICNTAAAAKTTFECERLILDEPQQLEQLAKLSDVNLSNNGDAPTPDNLAYIIFTSGSSGQPKGVEITHANVVGYYHSAQQHYGVGPTDKVLQFATINFDASVEEMFVTLCSGAHLVASTEGEIMDDEQFWAFIGHHQISVCSLPTAYWQFVCENIDHKAASIAGAQFRLCIIGGQAYSGRHAKAWAESFASTEVQLINTYGPTEGTVIATACRIDNDATKWRRQCIGTSVEGMHCYIFDPAGNLSPRGVSGELYLAGVQVARGYCNNAQATNDAFKQISINGVSIRAYRTGDKVRYNNQGEIEFIGRVDRQVKIRGFRIELSGIEATLLGHPGVVAAHVLVSGSSATAQQLIACTQISEATTFAALEQYLENELPLYMLPRLVVLDKMPSLPNGKIDGQALSQMDFSDDHKSHKAPSNDTEAALVVALQKLLRVDSIGVDEDLFRIGANSLMMVRLTHDINREYGLNFTVSEFYEHPFIEYIAGEIDKQRVLAALTSSEETDDSDMEEGLL